MWPIGHKYSQIKVVKKKALGRGPSTCPGASPGMEAKGKLQGPPRTLGMLSSWRRSFDTQERLSEDHPSKFLGAIP